MGELASDGKYIYPEYSSHSYGYDGNGNLITDTVVQYGSTYVKTFTYTNNNLTGESLWVKQ